MMTWWQYVLGVPGAFVIMITMVAFIVAIPVMIVTVIREAIEDHRKAKIRRQKETEEERAAIKATKRKGAIKIVIGWTVFIIAMLMLICGMMLIEQITGVKLFS